MDKGTEIEGKRKLVVFLEKAGKKDAAIWLAVAGFMKRAKRKMVEVNLNKVSGMMDGSKAIIVPGKVLSLGNVSGKGVIAAYAYSKPAREKLLKAGWSMPSINELVEKNPKGSGVKIVI